MRHGLFNDDEIDTLALNVARGWIADLEVVHKRQIARRAAEDAQGKRDEARNQLEKRRTSLEAEQMFEQYVRRANVVVVKKRQRGLRDAA